MKFGKYLQANLRDEWYSQYLNYNELKELIKVAASAPNRVDVQPASPRTTSLSVSRHADHDSLHEKFYALLNSEVGDRSLLGAFACAKGLFGACSFCRCQRAPGVA